MVQLVRHPQTKERDPIGYPKPPRHLRLYSPRSVWHTPAVLAANWFEKRSVFWNAFTLSVKLTARKSIHNTRQRSIIDALRVGCRPNDRTEDAA